MALGITNAKIISGGSGGGDTVYAVSETALNVDDKVYLNKHYYDSYEANEYNQGAINSDFYRAGAYCENNGDIYGFANKELLHWMYNSENKSWVQNNTPVTDSGTPKYFIKYEDLIVFKNHSYLNGNTRALADKIITKSGCVYTSGLRILSKGIGLKYANSNSTSNLVSFDPITCEILETYGSVSHGNYIGTAILENNILLLISGAGYYFYDVTDLNSPVLLNNADIVGYTDMAYTGISNGDYIFLVDTQGVNYVSSAVKTYPYKITEDYHLVPATDLPSEFYQDIATSTATFRFNHENNTLSFGNSTSVSLYKFVNGAFKKLSYNIPLTEDYTPYGGYGYLLTVSEDLSTAMIVARRTDDYVARTIYKMVNNNDNWYAEDYIHSNALSLQGFATGNVDEQGLYEISTVLPKKINLTINTNVDAVVEMRGDVE